MGKNNKITNNKSRAGRHIHIVRLTDKSNINNEINNDEQRMTSLEIAELTGKPHNDVLKAIRKMEPAWERV